MDEPPVEQLLAAAIRNAHDAEQRLNAVTRSSHPDYPGEYELAKARTALANTYARITQAAATA